MELFYLKTTDDSLSVKERAKPIKFKEILTKGALEKDLERLIVENPGLLDWSDHNSSLDEEPDLLIISRQKCFGKEPDLLAIDRQANLVVIEIKRDAVDEKNRKEAFEFQAIRYAAASRKMTPHQIIDLFAGYLKDLEADKKDVDWREEAVSKLCEHLSGEEEVSEDDLEELLNPRDQQKIYLVAADYEPDVTSACAWLQEHNINIACFRLRPYKIGDRMILERERLIPPPELDDFMPETVPISDQRREYQKGRTITNPSDPAQCLTWQDGDGSEISVNGWTHALYLGHQKTRELNLSEDDLQMQHHPDDKDFDPSSSSKPMKIKENLFIDKHGSANQLRTLLSIMFRNLDKEKGFLQILTHSGASYELP